MQRRPPIFGRTALIAAISVLVLVGSATAQEPPKQEGPPPSACDNKNLSAIEKDFCRATAILYAEDESGSKQNLCSVTAFERKGKVYRFLTAAHCVAEDGEDKTVDVVPTKFYITFDETGIQRYYPVKVIGVGYQHRGDDFAVLEATLDRDVPTIPISTADAATGEKITNFAAPHGYGIQLFRGHVSKDTLDRPVVEGDINWTGGVLLNLMGGPGSSGSAVVSVEKKAIVAVFVGRVGNGNFQVRVGLKASRFLTFYQSIQKGAYKYFKPDRDERASTGSIDKRIAKLRKKLKKGIVFKEDD
jgi:hypothetical protein